MGESGNSELANLNAAIRAVRSVRNSATHYFETLATEGKDCEPEVTELKVNLKELERLIQSLPQMVLPVGLSNMDLIALDPAPDKLNLYHQLRDTYNWTDKTHTYAAQVYAICSTNHLKRSNVTMPVLIKRKKTIPSTNNINPLPRQVDELITTIKNQYQDMTINVVRPYGNNAVLMITLGRVFKAVVTFRGLLIEWVVVRAYGESHRDEEGKIDLYSQSQYKVFRKVTDNANASMLHFCTPGLHDISIKSFFTWLHSFSTLFTDVCRKCNNHLHNHMPPTWREFRTLYPYHEECRP